MGAHQGQLLEGVECHIYLYCFTFDDINLNRAFFIIVLFPKIYSNKKLCANDMRKKNALTSRHKLERFLFSRYLVAKRCICH